MKHDNQYLYAATYDNKIQPRYIAKTAKEVRAVVSDNWHLGLHDWSYCYRQGWRVVPVTVARGS